MTTVRDKQIARINRLFKELLEFSRDSWSNIAIEAKVVALHIEVQNLYPYVVAAEVPKVEPEQPKCRNRRFKAAVKKIETFERVEVTNSTRWG